MEVALAQADLDAVEATPNQTQDECTDVPEEATEKQLCFQQSAKRKSTAVSGMHEPLHSRMAARMSNAARGPPARSVRHPPPTAINPVTSGHPAVSSPSRPATSSTAPYRHRYVPIPLTTRPAPRYRPTTRAHRPPVVAAPIRQPLPCPEQGAPDYPSAPAERYPPDSPYRSPPVTSVHPTQLENDQQSGSPSLARPSHRA